MKSKITGAKRVIGFAVASGRYGYAAFEGLETLVDWGTAKTPTSDLSVGVGKARKLISWLKPEVAVLEDLDDPEIRKGFNARRLVLLLTKELERARIPIKRVRKVQVRQSFSRTSATSKQEVAIAIAKLYPELQRYLPAPRKIWMSEDRRMGIFEAVGLCLAAHGFGSQAARKPYQTTA